MWQPNSTSDRTEIYGSLTISDNSALTGLAGLNGMTTYPIYDDTYRSRQQYSQRSVGWQGFFPRQQEETLLIQSFHRVDEHWAQNLVDVSGLPSRCCISCTCTGMDSALHSSLMLPEKIVRFNSLNATVHLYINIFTYTYIHLHLHEYIHSYTLM